MEKGKTKCPDCGVEVGEYHLSGCDVPRCTRCGGQALSCDCPDEDPDFHWNIQTEPWDGNR